VLFFPTLVDNMFTQDGLYREIYILALIFVFGFYVIYISHGYLYIIHCLLSVMKVQVLVVWVENIFRRCSCIEIEIDINTSL
jgi:hypothetical protein